jgi:polyhydroxyalkanoate synthesis regulator phasin
MRKKKYVATGLLAGLTAGIGAGFVVSQTGAAGASAPSVIEAAALQDDDTGTTTDDTSTTAGPRRPGDRIREVLAPLVEDGTLTEAQLDAVVDALVAARPEHGPGRGHGPGHHRGPRGAHLDTVAEVLGISVEDLRTRLEAGETIAEIAGERTQAVIDALVAEATDRINQGVADGRITQEEADEKLADLTQRITDHVNNGRRQPAADAPAAEDTGS